jgi:hypothetical protein
LSNRGIEAEATEIDAIVAKYVLELKDDEFKDIN